MNFWIIIVVLVVVLMVFEIMVLRKFRSRKKLGSREQQYIRMHLEQITRLPLKQQIMEYDKLLDHCLKAKGMTGTLGEKMKAYQGFRDTSGIWTAHKLRNRLAHEVGFEPNQRETEYAVRKFQSEINSFLSR